MSAVDPTGRFTNRVSDYVKYRPTYPAAVLSVLAERCGFTPASTVADLGSGTGILGNLLLRHGNRVFGVEPNAEMRAAGETLLADFPNFISVAATAEATTLEDHSVDFITAGQAFHWFDRVKVRPEFARILRPGGWVVLLWNDRRQGAGATPFLRAYEELLQEFGTDYEAVRRQWDLSLQQFRAFTGSLEAGLVLLDNVQHLDAEALRGRTTSSSFVPGKGHPAYEPMLKRLDEIHHQYQTDGTVAFEYETKIFYSQLANN